MSPIVFGHSDAGKGGAERRENTNRILDALSFRAASAMSDPQLIITTRQAIDASPFLSPSAVIAVEHHIPTTNYEQMKREFLRFLETAPMDWCAWAAIQFGSGRIYGLGRYTLWEWADIRFGSGPIYKLGRYTIRE